MILVRTLNRDIAQYNDLPSGEEAQASEPAIEGGGVAHCRFVSDHIVSSSSSRGCRGSRLAPRSLRRTRRGPNRGGIRSNAPAVVAGVAPVGPSSPPASRSVGPDARVGRAYDGSRSRASMVHDIMFRRGARVV